MFKLRVMGVLFTLIVLMLSFFSVSAQRSGGGLAPNPTATSVPRDIDGDGIFNADDSCPNEAGPRSNGGCPEPDTGRDTDNNGGDGGGNNGSGSTNPQPTGDIDGDGTGDSTDQCPTVPGLAENNGCPGVTPIPDPCTGQASTPSCDPQEPPTFPTYACFVSAVGRPVNVRTEPNENAEIIGRIEVGALVQIEEIVFANDGGGEFWGKILDNSEITLDDLADMNKDAYASIAVLAYGYCQFPQGEDPVGRGDADSLVAETAPLCHMSFGRDVSWSDYPEMGDVSYLSVLFNFWPGTDIPAGTMIAGVIFIEDFIQLPDAENSFAVLTDPEYVAAAQAAVDAAAFGWPTLAGGLQSGDVILPRLMSSVADFDDGTGRCGAIVDANSGGTNPAEIEVQIDELACTVIAPPWIFAFDQAPGTAMQEGAHPIAILNYEPHPDSDLWEDPNLWSLVWSTLDDDELMYYQGAGYFERNGGTCGALIAEASLVTPEPAREEVQTLSRPIDEFACTVTAAQGWVFAFNASPGEELALGQHPIAVLAGNPAFSFDPDVWATLQHNGNSGIVDYMGISREEDDWLEMPRTGGTCGPIAGGTAINRTAASAHSNGANFAFADGSVRFISQSIDMNVNLMPDECEEGWMLDIYESTRRDVFYCSPQGLADQNNDSAAPPDNPFDCPEHWVGNVYESERADIFTCAPTELETDTAQTGLGMECPPGWISDIYETEVSNVFYCRPVTLLTQDSQNGTRQVLVLENSILEGRNIDGIGMECPVTWIYDVYVGLRSDVFYCAPVDLATRP